NALTVYIIAAPAMGLNNSDKSRINAVTVLHSKMAITP
ncbi:MAG: hypothetical protein ACI96N_001805, partial [Arenicella sp.]